MTLLNMHRRAVVATLLLLSLPAQTMAQTPSSAPRKLSLDEAVRLARTRSPLAFAASARVAGAAARASGAASLASPTLAVAHGAGRDTGGLDEDVLITQTLELGDKQRQRTRAARAEAAAARADRSGTEADLTFQTQSAYFEALRADAEMDLARSELDNARRFTEAADTQFRAGDVARSNVVRSQIEVTRAEQELAKAEAERASRYDALRSLAGLAKSGEFELTDKLAYRPVAPKAEDLIALALKRPDVQSARLLKAARDASLHEARARFQPDLTIEARRANVDKSDSGSSVRFGLTLPLLDLGRERADARSAKAAADEQGALLAEAERVARLDVEDASRDLDVARKVVESYRTGRLDRAKELLDMAQVGYAKGASSYLELLDAQQVYRSEQAGYARALADYNIARAALQRAVGGMLP